MQVSNGTLFEKKVYWRCN